jgi:hypothetical protein
MPRSALIGVAERDVMAAVTQLAGLQVVDAGRTAVWLVARL